MRWQVRGLTALVAVAVVAAGVSAASSTGSTGGGPATAYQIDPAHDGFQADAALAPPLAARWTAMLPNAASYPLVAGGTVFVTASNAPGSGTVVYALDAADGHVLWQRAIPGTYHFSAAAYDAGRLFVVNDAGLLQALDPATGAVLWSTQLPGQSLFTSPPTALNGVVYTSGAGSGGTLYAVSETSGELLATQPVANGDHSSPALAAGDAFVSYACDQSYAFTQGKLAPVWHDDLGCEGGGGKTAVYAGGRLYVRDATEGNRVLDAGDGSLVSRLDGGAMPAPAADATRLVVLAGGVLSERSLADGSTGWTFSGDGRLDSAPILLATASGEYVAEGSGSGMLYLLDATTGTVAWSANVGAPIPAPDEQNVTQLTGLAAGEGLLVVPAGSRLVAYASLPAPVVGSFMPASGPVGTAVTISGTGFTGATAVRFGGAGAAFTITGDTQITAGVPAGAASGPISVTTPGGTGTSSSSFTVTVPDFALAATPASQSVAAGRSVTYTVTVTPSGGFGGTVALSVKGLPTGASASFSPTSTTSNSTLTVTVARNAKPASATLTITGTSGGLVHTATVALQIRKK